jgi:hypothetical protein
MINILPSDEVLAYITTRGKKISPQSVLITLTPSSKGRMFFYYTECLMIQVCIMFLEGQLLKKIKSHQLR